MTLDIFSNKIDDRLSQLLLDNLNTDEQQIFVQSFKAYLEYGDDDNKFVINLDDVWKWVGFTRKDNAKTLLLKHFVENKDYTVLLLQLQKQVYEGEKSYGGQNKETITMTVNTFKKFCMKASTKRADEVCDYYVKMENIMHQHIKEKLLEHEQKLLKISEERSILVEKLDEAIKKNKHTTETAGYVYVAGNLKESHKKAHKVGSAINDKNRESSLNTGEMDGCNRILVKFHTKNRVLAEKLIHTYLTCHKFHYNKEFFTIDLDTLISICKYFTKIVDQTTDVSMDELYARLVISESTHLKIINNNDNSTTNNDNSTTNNDININIQVPQDQIEDFKYFSMDTYKQFIEENIIPQIDSHVLSEKLRNAFSKWVSTKDIKPKKYNVRQLYMEKQGFHNEFKDALENVLEIPQTRIYNSGKIRGFDHIKLKDDV
jgi:hypothetical protein